MLVATCFPDTHPTTSCAYLHSYYYQGTPVRREWQVGVPPLKLLILLEGFIFVDHQPHNQALLEEVVGFGGGGAGAGGVLLLQLTLN